MIEVEVFAAYVGEDYETSDRQADLNRSLLVASALVDDSLVSAHRLMPESVKDQVVLDVALAVYQRSGDNTGQYDTESPAGPLDPLMRVRSILDRYRVSGV